MRPTAYRLHVDVDPSVGKQYRGDVAIDLTLSRPTDRIELHAADLEVDAAVLEVGRTSYDGIVTAHRERESISIAWVEASDTLRRARKARPKKARAPKGRAVLRLRFSGTLRSDLHGFYAASSGERKYAFTQLEAADARRFFPCFDEPAFKARFSLAVTTGEQNNVISNSPVERVQMFSDGRKTVYFRETPLLSTYLVALAIGELAASEPVYVGRVPIRVLHVPGSEALTGFALEAAHASLSRLVDYFGIPYPYEKLDLVAVPDFEIGAMENAGAVFFRETLLLVDEATVSLAEKKRAAEVICHELAHMWYGNLVTMQWWDDLWLNEAFATWMAFDIVAKWRPEWRMWNDFGHSRNSALHLDALDNTHAIYTKVETPAEATENFDLITYEKGAAVVRMIERYLGPAVFQRGVRSYLKKHREGNAVAADLWSALGKAAGRDVTTVVRAWITTPGFPLVRVSRRSRARGSELVLRQEPFDARGPASNRRTRKKTARWPVPWVGRMGRGTSPDSASTVRETKLERALLRKASETVDLRGDLAFVYGNADEGGFFRPLHEGSLHQAVIAALPGLSSIERLGFVHHTWAHVRAGYAPLDAFLPLLSTLASEPEADVLRALVGPLAVLVEDIAAAAGADVHAAMQALVARTWQPAFEAVGWHARGTERDEARLRRGELAVLLGLIAEDPAVVAAGERACEEYLRTRSSIDPNVVPAALTLGARSADAARFEAYLRASVSDPTPQERRRFRLALGDVRDATLVERAVDACLGDDIPTQDVALLLARLLGNRHAQKSAWELIKTRWPALRERMPAMLVSRLIEATPALGGERYQKDVARFFAAHPVPTAARALRQADERFELDAAFRKRAAPELSRLLAASDK